MMFMKRGPDDECANIIFTAQRFWKRLARVGNHEDRDVGVASIIFGSEFEGRSAKLHHYYINFVLQGRFHQLHD
jgi:hypothetical protein